MKVIFQGSRSLLQLPLVTVTVTFDADTEGTAVTTAGGNDNITTNSGADAISTGDGTDTVNAGLGIDNITFGDGAKTLNITFITVAQAVTANRKIVTGFDAETDSSTNGPALALLVPAVTTALWPVAQQPTSLPRKQRLKVLLWPIRLL